MSRNRLFVAIPLDEKYTSQIENDLKYLDDYVWKKTTKENLHLTLLYIGDVEDNLIPYVEEIIENIVSRTRPISFMGGRSLIMQPDEPTMLWLKYDRNKYFENLVNDLEKYFKKIGSWEALKLRRTYKNNNQPIPHITLAKIRGGGMLDSLLPPIDISNKIESFTSRSIVLYRSNRDQITGNISYERLKEWVI